MADITRYLKLITSEHSGKPKFTGLLTSVLEKADIAVDFDSAFDIDTAVGVQLDVLGIILGVSRILNFQPSDGSSSILIDNDYRSLLKAKIIMNQWNGELGTLSDALSSWDPSLNFVIKDNQNMTADILVLGTNDLQKELITNGYVVPKPAGVEFNYSMSATAVFAYDTNTDTLTGYDTGSWI